MLWIAILSLYAVMSLVTIGYYGLDKYRAVHNGWRIPERTLHTLELLGGWPGAILAQAIFRHKWRKTWFMFIFGCIVTLHLIVWALVAWLRIR